MLSLSFGNRIQESKGGLRECCSGESRGAVYNCRTGCTCRRPEFHTGNDPSRQLLPRYWTTNSHQCWCKWSHTPRACEPNVIRAWLRWGSGNVDERSCWRRVSLRLPSAVLENTKRHEEFQRKCTLRNGTRRTLWLVRSSTLVKALLVFDVGRVDFSAFVLFTEYIKTSFKLLNGKTWATWLGLSLCAFLLIVRFCI